jgi:hypothetical protein
VSSLDITATLQVPNINIVSLIEGLGFELEATLYAPIINISKTSDIPGIDAVLWNGITDSTNIPATLHITATLQVPIISYGRRVLPEWFSLRVRLQPALRVRYIDDPVVTGGCPQCGTYLFNTGRSVNSEMVSHGRNIDKYTYRDDRFVKCARCGFTCNADRHRHHPKGSRAGWGMKYVEIDANTEGDVAS